MSFSRPIAAVIAALTLGFLGAACGGGATPPTVVERSAPAATKEDIGPTTTVATAVEVARIVDGDTFEGTDGITYRLAAIDAPEAGTELGPVATQRLTELLTGELRIELGEVADTDRYGRTLAYIFAGETFVNEKLIREGLAEEAFFGDNVMYRDRYLAAQASAQAEGLGLWAEAPAPPPTTAPPTTVPPTTAPPASAPPPPVAVPPPPPPPPPAAPPAACTPGYDPCIPPGDDVDCAGGSGNGPRYTGPVRVSGPDIYDLDRDGDGLGCE